MIVNKVQLAEIVGVDKRSITDWQKDPNFPIEKKAEKRGQPNEYDTVKVIQWILSREAGSGGGSLDGEKTRLTKAQADKTEIEVQQLLGNLIPAELVEKILVAMGTNFRSKLRSLPAKLAPKLAAETKPKKCRLMLNAEINSCLEEISSQVPQQFVTEMEDSDQAKQDTHEHHTTAAKGKGESGAGENSGQNAGSGKAAARSENK